MPFVDLLFRSLFTDSGISAGLAKLNADLTRLGTTGPAARQGLRGMQQGMRALAFEAAGVGGPLGKVTQGLLMFGGGSALVLGAAAGIGLVAAAYKGFTADARAAEKAQADFVESLKKTPEGTAIAARNALQIAQEKLAIAERISAQARTQPGGPGPLTEANLEAARRNVATLQNAVAAAERAADEAIGRQMSAIEHRGEEFAKTFITGIKNLDPGVQLRTLLVARPQFDRAGGEAGRAWAEAFLEQAARLEPAAGLRMLLSNRAAFEAAGFTAMEMWRNGVLK